MVSFLEQVPVYIIADPRYELPEPRTPGSRYLFSRISRISVTRQVTSSIHSVTGGFSEMNLNFQILTIDEINQALWSQSAYTFLGNMI